MVIRELDIDGFGIFSSQVIGPLGDGLNVLLGSNEAGKSTLLAFIRTLLFGFPDGRMRDNPYVPLRGGVHGGRILLACADGAQYRVERRAGPRGGSVTVTGPDGSAGPEQLRAILGTMTRELFRNVYAFSLSELQSFETLQSDAVRAALYGASAGASILALPRVEGELTRRLGEIYKPAGTNPRLNVLLAELEQRQRALQEAIDAVQRYDEIADRLAAIAHEVGQLRDREQQVSRELRRQEMLVGLRKTWLELLDVERQLEELRQLPAPFPTDGLSRFDTLSTARAVRVEHVVRAEQQLANLEAQLAAVAVDPRVLQQGEAIERLAARPGVRPDHAPQLATVRADLETARTRLAATLAELGPQWSPERLRRIDRSLLTREAIRSHQATLQETRTAVERQRAALASEEATHARLVEERTTLEAALQELPDSDPPPADADVARVRAVRNDLTEAARRLADSEARLADERQTLERLWNDLGSEWNADRLARVDLSRATETALDTLNQQIETATSEREAAAAALAACDDRCASERRTREAAERALADAPPVSAPRATLDARLTELRTLRRLLEQRNRAIAALDTQRQRLDDVRTRCAEIERELSGLADERSAAADRLQLAEQAWQEEQRRLTELGAPQASRPVLEAQQAALRGQRRLLARLLAAREQEQLRQQRLAEIDRTLADLAAAAPAPASRGVAAAGIALLVAAGAAVGLLVAADRALIALPPQLPAVTPATAFPAAAALGVIGVLLLVVYAAAARRTRAAHERDRVRVETLAAERTGIERDVAALQRTARDALAAWQGEASEDPPSTLDDIDARLDAIQAALLHAQDHALHSAAESAARTRAHEARLALRAVEERAGRTRHLLDQLQAQIGAVEASPANPTAALPHGAPALRVTVEQLADIVDRLTEQIRSAADTLGVPAPEAPEEVDPLEADTQQAREQLAQRTLLERQVAHARERETAAETERAALAERVQAAEQVLVALRQTWSDRLATAGLPADTTAARVWSLLPLLRAAREHLASCAQEEANCTRSHAMLARLADELAPWLPGPVDLAPDQLIEAVDRLLVRWSELARTHEQRRHTLQNCREADRRLSISATALAQTRHHLAAAEAAETAARDAWRAWLRTSGLPEDLSPESALDALQRIGSGVAADDDVARLTTQERALASEAADCRAAADAIVAAIGMPPTDEPLPPLASRLVARLAEQRTAETRRAQLARATEDARQALQSEQRLYATVEEEIAELVRRAGAGDVEEFRAFGAIDATRRTLTTRREQLERTLREVGGTADLSALRTELAALDPDAADACLTALSDERARLEQQRDEINAERARLETEQQRLASSDTVAELRAGRERLRTEITTLAREWARLAIGQHLLGEAKRRFERERQPRVLRDASTFLALLTGGRYVEVRASLDRGGELEVFAADGTSRAPTVLSRGTAEQLYLALRFGYIVNHQIRDEAMPVVMDEVLVNFDPHRAGCAAEPIRRFAADRQVLFFTCHPWVAELLAAGHTDVRVWDIADGSAAMRDQPAAAAS